MASAAGVMYAPLVSGPTERPLPFVLSVGEWDDFFTDALGVAPLPMSESFLSQPAAKAWIVEPYLTTLDLTDAYVYDELMIEGKQVARWTYETGNGAPAGSLQVLLIEDLAHAYPRGLNHPIVMADHLWAFFEVHSLP